MNPTSLLQNHWVFTRLHRGTARELPGAVDIRSELPGFGVAVLAAPSADPTLLRDHSQVRLVPGGESWEPRLREAGFREKGALRYMALEGDWRAWRSNAAVAIREARMAGDIDAFTEVQGRGFAEDDEKPEEISSLLGPWNRKNLGHPDQRFLIGELEGKPAGITLVVRSDGGKTAGIYAVATVPEARCRGVSTTLLRDAVAEEKRCGAELITLQVMEGTPAQRLYESLGFVTAFRSPIFARAILGA